MAEASVHTREKKMRFIIFRTTDRYYHDELETRPPHPDATWERIPETKIQDVPRRYAWVIYLTMDKLVALVDSLESDEELVIDGRTMEIVDNWRE